MSKIVILADDPHEASGFAINGRNIGRQLDKEHEVIFASLQANVNGEFEGMPIVPAADNKFGRTKMREIIEQYEPDVVLSVIDVQMCSYLGDLKYPKEVNITYRKGVKPASEEDVISGVKERLNHDNGIDFEWVSMVPVDGRPVPNDWKYKLEQMDKIVLMSNFAANVFDEQFPELDYDVIPHGIHYDKYEGLEKNYTNFTIGTVNRNQFRKQYPRLIEAMSKFYKSVGEPDDVSFYLHCDYNDDMGWDLNRFLEKYDIKDATIDPMGKVSRNSLRAIYANFDVFASATGGEGFGLTSCEALAAGTPVVITDYTTSEELIVDGDPTPRGKVIEPKLMYDELPSLSAVPRALVDTDKMAEAFEFYYNNPDILDEHGNNAKKWVEKLDWDNVGEQWLDLMDD